MNSFRLKTRILSVCLAVLMGSAGLLVLTSENTAVAADEATAARTVSRAMRDNGDTGSDDDGNSDDETAVHLLDASRGYSPKLYNNTSGLPTSEANAIVQTPEGFIWIGSYSGLVRYDGNTFERVSSAQTGITSVISLMVDSKGRLWVGTNDSGAGVLDKSNWTIFNKQNGLHSLSVHSIVEDENGRIYMGTTEGVVIISEDMTVTALETEQIKSAYVRKLALGPNNTIYALTIDGEIFTMKDGVLTGYYDTTILGSSDIHAILPDPEKEGYIYCATKGTDVFYGKLGQPLSRVIDSIEPLSYVNSINKIADEIWVCTDNGIGRIVDGHIIVLEHLPMTTSIECMMDDYQHNLWFVSSQQGVMKIVPSRFTNLYEQYRLTNDVVYSTCVSDNKLFIGTKTSGLIVLADHELQESLPIEHIRTASGVELEESDLIKFLAGTKIRSIVRDSKGNLWFSTFTEGKSLVRYDGRDAVVFSKNDGGLPSDRVRIVYECTDGSMAIACTGGVVILRDDKIVALYGEEAGINNAEILTVTQATNGALLIGTDGDGIYILENGKLQHINSDNGLPSDVVMRIKKDRSRDLYWIVASSYLAYMTPDYQITTINNFPYSNNFDIYQNKIDEMWVLSSNGIYVVPTEEMIANGEIIPFFYGMANGLSCFATSNSYSELTDGGDLYISGSTGVVLTNIDEPNTIDSDVIITVPYIEADGQRIYPSADGAFEVSSDVQKVTVYAYCFNYSLVNPELNLMLEGFDRNSMTVLRSDLKPIDYTNLSGGEYVFKMELLDSFGQVQKVSEVKIVKKKALTEQMWFKVLCLVLLVAVVAFIANIVGSHRMQRLKKKEQEQRILIREIVEAFAKVIDMKDEYTNGHSTRVAEYTAMLARELGYDEETVEKYRNIALLHDIGKVGIDKDTLNKNGRLTDEEFKEIKSHSGKGYAVLKNISIMPELAIGARDHHERPDGHGYPRGLKDGEIPRVAQIIAVADTFDAMYSDRPYRKRMNFDKAISIIKEVSGTQLTADVVDAFLRLVEKGEFRAADDTGGGTFDDITNIHKAQDKKKAEEDAAAAAKPEEENSSAGKALNSDGKALNDDAKAEKPAEDAPLSPEAEMPAEDEPLSPEAEKPAEDAPEEPSEK